MPLAIRPHDVFPDVKKMTIMIHRLRILSIAWVLSAVIQNYCYARFITTVTEIKVPCSPTQEEAQKQIYPGEQNTFLMLTTKGIKIEGELITNWDWQDVSVIARCVTSVGGITNLRNMFSGPGESSDVLPSLSCKRGEGIEVTMNRPNDLNPNKYLYIVPERKLFKGTQNPYETSTYSLDDIK